MNAIRYAQACVALMVTWVGLASSVQAAPHVHHGDCIAALLDFIAAADAASDAWDDYIDAVLEVDFAIKKNFTDETIQELVEEQRKAFDKYEAAVKKFNKALVDALQICPINL